MEDDSAICEHSEEEAIDCDAFVSNAAICEDAEEEAIDCEACCSDAAIMEDDFCSIADDSAAQALMEEEASS